jgi:hypothetical protein
MSVTLLITGGKERLEIPDEPLSFARAILGELGASASALPLRIGRETDAGYAYRSNEVARMVRALESALDALAERVDREGRPIGAATARNYFNEQQWLRGALDLFKRADASHREVMVSV